MDLRYARLRKTMHHKEKQCQEILAKMYEALGDEREHVVHESFGILEKRVRLIKFARVRYHFIELTRWPWWCDVPNGYNRITVHKDDVNPSFYKPFRSQVYFESASGQARYERLGRKWLKERGLVTADAEHLDTLGLDEDYTESQLNQARRRYAMRHHPDRGGDSAKFDEGMQAYDALRTK